ncbi:DNA repair protein rhp9 [Apiospora rasikravindrae]|uniref:DNA repair protein rhp9 n=1 Tax=Apiospora rasikravindrae TaxID=990691 RepID=A0ABR1SLR1_9PEZI
MAREKKPARSIAKAEERAYQGDNESQDSQLVMQNMHSLYGIGQLSSSPMRSAVPLSSHQGMFAHPFVWTCGRPINFADISENLIAALTDQLQQTTPAANASGVSTSRPQPPPPVTRATVNATEAPLSTGRQQSTATNQRQFKSVIGSDTVADDHALLPKLRPTPALKKKKKKMEDGSQSPTQSNEGRSYEQYQEIRGDNLASSQLKPTDSGDRYESQRSHPDSDHEHATLHEDETGAVNFDLGQFGPAAASNAHNLNDAETDSGSDDDESDRYSSIAPVSHPRRSSGFLPPPFVRNSSTGMPPPQTPALATRLIHAGGTAEPLMPSSQLFANTQFTSAVKKVASPTSSRPSPELNPNTISPNPQLISSPLRERGLRTSQLQVDTSSPYVPPPSSGPVPTTQDPYDAPESPYSKPQRIRSVPEPIRDYIPSRSSPAERQTSVEILDESGAVNSDSDVDLELRKRQRRAKRKQEEATRSLRTIPISRPSSRSEELIEVPSTNRRKLGSRSADQLAYGDNGEAQETVADSQDAATKNTAVAKDTVSQKKGALNSAAQETAISSSDIPLLPRVQPVNIHGSRDLIPETSPAGTAAAAEPKGPSPPILSNMSTEAESTPTLPPPKRLKRSEAEESDEIVMSDPGEQTKPMGSSPPIPSTAPLPTSQSSQPSRRSGRLQSVATPPACSFVHATPNVSSSTTPNTEDDEGGEEPPKNNPSSPAAAKVHRQSRPRSTMKTYSPGRQRAQRDRAKKEPSRLARQSSVSTDELARPSPSPASIAGQTRGSRSFRAAKDTSLHFPSGIFSGMIFVTTIGSSDNDKKRKTDAQKREEAEKEEKKEKMEALIRKGGGHIMNAGFHDLFEHQSSVVPEASSRISASCLSLTPEAANAGFTALITDNCSRKAKYMQALALGLPCLSWNWVSACNAKGSLVDWLPYMLCAGPSTVLDGAFKSRDLPGYEASSAKLSEIITQRPKLLSEMSVLLVVKKTKTQKHEKRCTFYAFLAHVLGANLERVNTTAEAGDLLREREEAGSPFDWVYPDGDDTIFSVLTAGPPTQVSNTKKRKRQSTTNSGSFGTPLRNMPRILTDELIVQSLILGRLVEEREMQ